MRLEKKRTISYLPKITYFKPVGSSSRQSEEIGLTFDELEAIRLAEWEDLNHEQAAQKMKISRITFRRILHFAHQKIAEALLFGKAIKIQGGIYNFKLRKEVISMPAGDGTGPVGTGRGIGRGIGRGPGMGTNRGRGRMPGGFGLGPEGNCVCPNCGAIKPHTRGIPCYKEKCPKCDQMMVRER